MTINEFYEEYENLTPERKRLALDRLFNEVLRDMEQYEDFIYSVLLEASTLEQDDYFGTEGLDV